MIREVDKTKLGLYPNPNPLNTCKIVALVLCAGSSNRFHSSYQTISNQKINKVFHLINDKPVFKYSIDKLSKLKSIDKIVIITNNKDIGFIQQSIELNPKVLKVILGGKTRTLSVRAGLNFLDSLKKKPKLIIIHDAARPNFDPILLDKFLADPKKPIACSFANDQNNSLYQINNKEVAGLPRDKIVATQTPQIFDFKQLVTLHNKYHYRDDFSDDIALFVTDNQKVEFINSPSNNIKITNYSDLKTLTKLLESNDIKKSYVTRVGFGFDIHALKEPKITSDNKNAHNKQLKLILAGIEIKYHKKLIGHSDADVVLHALTDAILGALSKKDIGYYFPDNDTKWFRSDSEVFLKKALSFVAQAQATINNIDIVILAQSPKLTKYIDNMIANIARICAISVDKVGIKATTYEKMDSIGQNKAIACYAICSIYCPCCETNNL